MTENIEQHEMNIDSDEYLFTIHNINMAFDNLREKLNKYRSPHCCYFVEMAYQSFINSVKEDIKH